MPMSLRLCYIEKMATHSSLLVSLEIVIPSSLQGLLLGPRVPVYKIGWSI